MAQPLGDLGQGQAERPKAIQGIVAHEAKSARCAGAGGAGCRGYWDSQSWSVPPMLYQKTSLRPLPS